MHNVLQKIIEATKKDLAARKTKNSVASMLRSSKDIAIIAEIKLASPSEPQLGSVNDVTPRAREYQRAGAAMISVVTEKHFFNGDPSFIRQIKRAGVTIPILQKDFVVDALQIVEAKQAGADGILLIAKLLRRKQLKQFVGLAMALGLAPVVEVNDEADLDAAIAADPEIIAVNARDLTTFEVNVDRACELMTRIPDSFIKLGFSGIVSRQEVMKYQQAGAQGVLVGTQLMKSSDREYFIKELQG